MNDTKPTTSLSNIDNCNDWFPSRNATHRIINSTRIRYNKFTHGPSDQLSVSYCLLLDGFFCCFRMSMGAVSGNCHSLSSLYLFSRLVHMLSATFSSALRWSSSVNVQARVTCAQTSDRQKNLMLCAYPVEDLSLALLDDCLCLFAELPAVDDPVQAPLEISSLSRAHPGRHEHRGSPLIRL